MWLRTRSIVCVPGASMQARAIQALRSVSPTPTMSSSVTTSTTIVSCAELVASTSKPGSSSTWVLTSRSEEHTSELQSQSNLVCRLLLEKKKNQNSATGSHYTT